jgi:uncharacterized tellurite resistance protein B-like protein
MADGATRRKFEALVAAAFADGYLADAEKIILQDKAERMGISNREMHEILGLGQQRKLSIGIPATTAERDALLEDLIEVVAADGRVEAPEYSLLARFAETLKIGLPELRQRVNRRMQGHSDRNTRAQTRRETPPAAPPRRVEPPAPPPPPSYASPPIMQPPTPMMAPTAAHAHKEFPKETKVADLPPVTLQLLKQSILFDTEADSLQNIGRTLGISSEDAARIRRAILAAFPDLKPASQVVRPPPRR